MSAIVKGFIPMKIIDFECLEQALVNLGIKYTKNNERIYINEACCREVIIEKKIDGVEITSRNLLEYENNNFIMRLSKEYEVVLKAKLERLEACLKEQIALRQYAEEERINREREIVKEIMRLEAIKRKEEAELKKQIEQKISKIKERAASMGYQIKEEIREKERVLILVRR